MKPIHLQVLIVLSILFSVVSFAVGAGPEKAVPSKPDAPIPAADTLWIDVRTPGEFSAGHLPGATNIPLQTLQYTFTEQIPDKDAVIALYCRSGNRSGQALRIVEQLGYSNAFNAGGLQRLLKARYK